MNLNHGRKHHEHHSHEHSKDGWKSSLFAVVIISGTLGYAYLTNPSPTRDEINFREQVRLSYDKLPDELKKYDLDGNRHLDGMELENLLRDYKLERR